MGFDAIPAPLSAHANEKNPVDSLEEAMFPDGEVHASERDTSVSDAHARDQLHDSTKFVEEYNTLSDHRCVKARIKFKDANSDSSIFRLQI